MDHCKAHYMLLNLAAFSSACLNITVKMKFLWPFVTGGLWLFSLAGLPRTLAL